MTSPYTTQPLDAFMAAQTSVGLVLAAVLWLRRLRPRIPLVLFVIAIALAVTAPVDWELLSGIGVTLGPNHFQHTLQVAAALASAAALLARKPFVAVVALLGQAALWKITNYVLGSDGELAALHVAFLGLLVGLYVRTPATEPPLSTSSLVDLPRGAWDGTSPAPPGRGRDLLDDLVAFAVGTTAAAVCCRILLHGWTNSGDEWANTFQAALFAKFKAYGSVPRCAEAFRSFWVFQYMGRSFSQYTPGWPLFMAPFVAVGAAWLAGPVSLGLLAAGIGRLGRRAAASLGGGGGPSFDARVRSAGRFSWLAAVFGSCALVNGASRYPHVFVAATFAWSVEALLAIATQGIAPRAQWLWGTLLGTAAAFMLAARPGDGGMLGIGLFLYFVYAVVRRRIGWRAVAGGAIGFALIAGLTLVILRLQVGRWFATGYSLTKLIYPWATFQLSLPQPSEYKYGIPIFTGAYCWLPCSPAIGLAGLALMRGRARRMAFIFFFAYLPFFSLYLALSLGRGFDLGYGPRYTLPSIVPMAVGTGVVLSVLMAAARVRWGNLPALRRGGPAAVALTALVVGVIRVAPLIYPPTYADVQNHNRLHEALAPLRLKNAVVIAGEGLTNTDPMDLTENLPLELYRDQSAIVAVDRGPDAVRCVRELYPTRAFYRAAGFPVRVVPY